MGRMRRRKMHKVGIDIGRSMVKATCNGEEVVEFPPLLAPVPPGGPVGLMDGRAERMEVLWEGARWMLGEGVRGSECRPRGGDRVRPALGRARGRGGAPVRRRADGRVRGRGTRRAAGPEG